jgi:hypothetical protein
MDCPIQEKNDYALPLEKEKALLIDAAKQFQYTVEYKNRSYTK